MKRGGINRSSIRRSIRKHAAKELKREAFARAKRQVEKAKSLMLAEFDNHPITREIKAGPNATNSSGTLSGTGNLFSFIGFDSGDKPITPVRRLLESSTKLRSVNVKKSGDLAFDVVIELPSREELEQASPLPWAAARSWIIGVEHGLSGLGQYLVQPGAGRSGGGIEIKGKIRSGKFKNSKYVSQILANLQKNLMKFLNS